MFLKFLILIILLMNQIWEDCFAVPPYISNKYTTINVEIPSIIEEKIPQRLTAYIKNKCGKNLEIDRLIIYAYGAYPVSLETKVKITESWFYHYTVPDCFGCNMFIWNEGICSIEPEEHLKINEEWKFSCDLVFDMRALHYISDIWVMVHIIPDGVYDKYYISKDVYNEDKSCFKKEINPSKYYWEPDEEGEVEIKLKNNCNEELYPAFDKSLYLEFGSYFDILEIIETNAKGWEKKEDWLIDFYFDHLKLGEEWYAKIKVKAKYDYGAGMHLSLINEKDKNNGFSTEEEVFTFVEVYSNGGIK